MTVLITGAAGFIGTNFVYFIRKTHPDWRIVAVDCFTYAGNPHNLEPLSNCSLFKLYPVNICDKESIFSIFTVEKPDYVVNFAAESHVDRSISNPEIFAQTNVMGTLTLLEACKKFGVIRYHQVSTDEVYGDLPLNRPDLLFSETSQIRPSSPYSASKASADFFVLSYNKTYGLPVSVSRCSNNYGAYQYPEKLIPLVFTRAMNNLPIPVYGTGQNIRDWLYVEDHCSAIENIMLHGTAGEIYNIGGNNEQSNINIVKLICRTLNKSENLITFVADRKGHDLRYAINAEKIKQELGWMPKTSFEDGIKKTIEWYKSNEDRWTALLK